MWGRIRYQLRIGEEMRGGKNQGLKSEIHIHIHLP
jgi:hypothetical protein